MLVLAVVIVRPQSTEPEPGTDYSAEETTQEEQESETWAEAEIQLTDHEAELLYELYHDMENGELDDAARLLNENADAFKQITDETFAGERYLIRVDEQEEEELPQRILLEELSEDSERRGLVLSRYNTAFFGDFGSGRPEGDCTAIQAIVLDEPRYTYASGIWQGGKMNGQGTTGYLYYEKVPESGFVMAEKYGNYTDDFLDGMFFYRTENADGETLRWQIQAEMGVTILDERWIRRESGDGYFLPADNQPERAYVLGAERAEAAIWNNLIGWED